VFVEDAATRGCNRRYRLHALTEAGLRTMTASLCPGDLVKMPLPPPPVTPDASADPPPVQAEPDAGAPSGGGAGGARGSDPAIHETDVRSGCAVGRGGTAGAAALVALLGLVRLAKRRRRR
jgi:MYXO-CTERM domain-containing protein